MKYIKKFESLDESEFSEDQMVEIKDIFQEYIDEYHMVKSVPYPYGMGYTLIPDRMFAWKQRNIPENIYYSVGLYGKDWPNNNFACIEVWLDSPDSNFSYGLRKEYRRFLDNRYTLLDKIRGFGYHIIDSYQSTYDSIKIKIGE